MDSKGSGWTRSLLRCSTSTQASPTLAPSTFPSSFRYPTRCIATSSSGGKRNGDGDSLRTITRLSGILNLDEHTLRQLCRLDDQFTRPIIDRTHRVDSIHDQVQH